MTYSAGMEDEDNARTKPTTPFSGTLPSFPPLNDHRGVEILYSQVPLLFDSNFHGKGLNNEPANNDFRRLVEVDNIIIYSVCLQI